MWLCGCVCGCKGCQTPIIHTPLPHPSQLFGANNSWGRLPYTMYPLAFAGAINISDAAVSTGVGRTYRYYNASFKATGPALYSFGDGLSYSQFATTCRCVWTLS